MKFSFAAALLGCAFAVSSASAAVLFSGTPYSQNFDTLPSTGSSITWANDSTLTGWSLFRQPAPGTAIPTIIPDNGGSTTGSFFSYGSTGSTDRALGGLGSGGTYFGSPVSGSVAGWIALNITNSGTDTYDSVTLRFDGEQWRNGGNTTAQSMVLQYGFGSSFANVATWTAPGSSFNWTSPVATATAAAVNGNSTGRVATVGGTISNLSFEPGQTLWFRWIENNDTGNDHGLAIDNVTFSATAVVVPEPAAFGLLVPAILGLRRNRR